MSLTISVPLNTMLADLDESLRGLLGRELSRHGFEGVNIAFDAPTREWSAALSVPTINLFLYDLREAVQLRQGEWPEHRGNGHARLTRPPLRLDCSYAITAWARAVEDEHRMLSQAMAVLYAHELLRPGDLAGALADPTAQRYPVSTRVAQAKEADKADFWNAIGGSYRVALDYVVTLSCEPGVSHERGPEARTPTVRIGPREGGRAAMEEYHHAGGLVTNASGEPAAGAWVTLPDLGSFAESDMRGRFRFARVPAGSHRCVARGSDGSEVAGRLAVPGQGAELTLPAARPR